jgi:hypothetical protein
VTGETIFIGCCVGVGATLMMDVLGNSFRRLGLAAGAKGEWLGRWYLGMVRGRFVHSNIVVAPVQAGERLAALVGHYAIGIALAVVYVAVTGWLGVPSGMPLVAIGYGLATCVFPWFLVFPALGFGRFGLKGPPESRLLASSLLNHCAYGIGLWSFARLLPVGA